MATRIMVMPGCRVPDAVVVSGAGPYLDPWHDFPATSGRLAAILRDLGLAVEVTEEVEDALAHPGSARLVVVNIGNPVDPRPSDAMEAAAQGLLDHLAAGGALLGVHSSAGSLPGMRQWPDILGGRWVRGTSMHPPMDDFTVHVTDADHPVTHGMTDFPTHDERYSYLETRPDATILAEHELESRSHPLVWVCEHGAGRVVYNALGHSVRGYESSGQIELLRRSVRWLTRMGPE
jgi:uncharacterized protein